MKEKNTLVICCLAFAISSYGEQSSDAPEFFSDTFITDDNFLEFDDVQEPTHKKPRYQEEAHRITEIVGMQVFLGALYIMELWSNSCNAVKKYLERFKKNTAHEA